MDHRFMTFDFTELLKDEILVTPYVKLVPNSLTTVKVYSKILNVKMQKMGDNVH